MKRASLTLPAAIVALTLSLASCSTDVGSASISVVASTDVWGNLAATIGGDNVRVTSLIDNPDADPHEYEANTRNQLALSKAKVVIENGGGYDDFVDRMLKSAKNDSATVLNAVTISDKSAPAGELNEHVWYDFPTVQKVIDKIASAYISADAAHAPSYRQNAASLKTKISGLEKTEAGLKKQYAGEAASITEPVPLYMLQAIGLRNETPTAFSEAVEQDTDVSAKVLARTLQLYSGHQVKLLAYNEQTSGPETEKVLTAAKQNHVAVVPVTETLPSGKDYTGWMSGNLKAIDSALSA